MDDYADRVDELNAAIDEKFRSTDPFEIDVDGVYFPDFVFDMVEVTRVLDGTCSVSLLFEAGEFSPVYFPPEIQPLVEVGDVFLVRMGLICDDWYVLFTSRLYENGPEEEWLH